MFIIETNDKPKTNAPVEESPKQETYNKFVLYICKGDSTSIVPWTGIDQTLNYVKEKLLEGYTIQIRPYSQEEWAKKMSQEVEL